MNCTVPEDHRVKMKENEPIYRYFDSAREPKKMWNMKVTVIPTAIGWPETTYKG